MIAGMHRAIALSCGLLLAQALYASETIRPGPNPYQLNLGNDADYRLKQPERAKEADSVAVTELEKKPFGQQINAAAQESHLDPALVHALIHVESRHQSLAVSPKGAVGLMQVLPETAQRFGINNPKSPDANLRAGTRYLRTLLDRFDQRLDLALAAYNAGEGAVIRFGNEIPPFPETRAYVPAVLEKYRELAAPAAPTSVTYLPGTRLEPRAMESLPLLRQE
jgi:soluble lytic murein transglycosylase-like protein